MQAQANITRQTQKIVSKISLLIISSGGRKCTLICKVITIPQEFTWKHNNVNPIAYSLDFGGLAHTKPLSLDCDVPRIFEQQGTLVLSVHRKVTTKHADMWFFLILWKNFSCAPFFVEKTLFAVDWLISFFLFLHGFLPWQTFKTKDFL